MTISLSMNELGGREYTVGEQTLINEIAMVLKNRDHSSINIPSHLPRPRPRDYMPLYVKAAGLVYEMAKILSHTVVPNMVEKDVSEWLYNITGHRFYYKTLRSEPSIEVVASETARPGEIRVLKSGDDGPEECGNVINVDPVK